MTADPSNRFDNERDTTVSGPLAGWSMVQTQGLTLIGKRVDTSDLTGRIVRRLDPVFEMVVVMLAAQGGIAVLRSVRPVWNLNSVTSFPFEDGAIAVPIESLSLEDRKELALGVAGAMQAVDAARAAQAGIVLAGPNTRLPPLNGRA